MSNKQEAPDLLRDPDVSDTDWLDREEALSARRARHIWLAGLVASAFLGGLSAFGETRMDSGLSEAFAVALDPQTGGLNLSRQR